MTHEEAAKDIRVQLTNDDDLIAKRYIIGNEVKVDREALRTLLSAYEAALKDLCRANKCITCIHNAGAEGKLKCKNPDQGIRLVNRKEDRYVRVECCGWDWRGPEPGGEDTNAKADS